MKAKGQNIKKKDLWDTIVKIIIAIAGILAGVTTTQAMNLFA